MSTFINLYIGEPAPKTYIKRHLVYSILWLIDITVLILRLDTYILKAVNANYNFFSVAIPLFLIATNVVLFLSQKWYYNLAFIFYPILLGFWFIPKLILEKGKLYLFLYYLSIILKYLSEFKKSLVKFFILFLTTSLLLTTDNKYIRILSICYFGYIYFKILLTYTIGSVKKKNSIKKPSNGDNSLSKIDLVDSLEKVKDNDKLTPEQNRSNKIKSMVLWTYFLQYIADNVNGYRGKRAFMIVWFFEYFLYFFLTLFFFTFLNYELFKIDPNNFAIASQPSLFEFFYYSFKNIALSSIDSLKPKSAIAQLAEMGSFFILAIWFLIVTISSILSLKIAEYSKDVEKAVKLCSIQNVKMEEHLRIKYNTDMQKAIMEIETINQSVSRLKTILEKIL